MNELQANPTGCEEASMLSREKYIPCNSPAARLIYSSRDNRTYRMCDGCADHAIHNRGMEDRGPFISRSPT
jgi:hypothetical protein